MSRASDTETSVTLLGRLRDESTSGAAWAEFVEKYGPKIYQWCRKWRLQEADARDVSQAVLLKLAARMQSFSYDPSGSFRGWLRTVTFNAWKDILAEDHRSERGSGDSQVLDMLQTIEARDELVEELYGEYERELLAAAIKCVQTRVEPRTWRAFMLLAMEQRSGREVAAELGLKVTAVIEAKSRVQAMIRREVNRLKGPDSD